MATRTTGSIEDEATIDLFLMKVGAREGDAVAAEHRRTLAALLESAPRRRVAELTPGDVEAYLDGLRWREASEDERRRARECCEEFLRLVSRVKPERSDEPTSEAARARDEKTAREPGKRHRRVWLGPFGSVIAAARLLLRDPGNALLATLVGWLVATLLPVVGAGPAGVGMTHVAARLDEEGKASAGDVLWGFRRALASVFALVVQLVVLGVVAALGAALVYGLFGLADLTRELGDLPRWIAGAGIAVAALTAGAAVLVGNWFLFVPALLARTELGALEACDASRDAVRDHWVQVLLVELVFGVVALLVSAVPVVGVVAAFGLWHALVWVLYRKLFE